MSEALVHKVRAAARPLQQPSDLDPLLERIGDARVVLLGEATHGTSEYYGWRARISERLLLEKDFSFLAVEGDWPDCYRLSRYVKGREDAGGSAFEVLHAFDRWPTWMWANQEIVELAEWLRTFNEGREPDDRVGFFGLDVYSLWDSLHAVLDFVRKIDGASLEHARQALRCFDPYGEDAQVYARATRFVGESCEAEVVGLLRDLRARREALRADGSRDAFFDAEQNALVARNAEAYYRAMVRGGGASWNLRDKHMMETLERLLRHHGPKAKAIVWEHNTHVGDARYTDMARAGMWNIGQLAREAWGEDRVVLVGFGSHRGTVIAGEEWEAPMMRMPVPAARQGSWEDVLHRASPQDKLLVFGGEADEEMLAVRPHRAIGVVYHPQWESYGNYVPTVLPRRYDAFLYVDQSHALEPLHFVERSEHDYPETWPSGF
ncbi:erythromycin esterase family protein [Vulgatibacter sp.]|uniref:erythromycin esterase family protein n=1 Tax=Vulgatibacter sp. TaxID=1971226 RepID=UPI00356B00D6